MKKLMTLMLGAALAIGSVSVYAATTQDQKETPKKKGTGSGKKNTNAKKKDGTPSK